MKPRKHACGAAFFVNKQYTTRAAPDGTALFFHKHNSSHINAPGLKMFDFEIKCPVLKISIPGAPAVTIPNRSRLYPNIRPFDLKPAVYAGVR